MTASEVVNIITSANKIGKNVFNFFDKFKPYELLLVQKNKPLTESGNDLLDRDVLIEYIKDESKPQYKKWNLLEIYDNVKYRMTWGEISTIYLSTQATFDCERYNLDKVREESESVYSLLDRTNGERIYVAADQTNSLVKYSYDEQGDELDPKTGEVKENVYVNRGKDKFGSDKHRNSMTYRD